MPSPTDNFQSWTWEQGLVNLLNAGKDSNEKLADRNAVAGPNVKWLEWISSNTVHSESREPSVHVGDGEIVFWMPTGSYTNISGMYPGDPGHHYVEYMVYKARSMWTAPRDGGTISDSFWVYLTAGDKSTQDVSGDNNAVFYPKSAEDAAVLFENVNAWLKSTTTTLKGLIDRIDDESSGFGGSASQAFMIALQNVHRRMQQLYDDVALPGRTEWDDRVRGKAADMRTWISTINTAWSKFKEQSGYSESPYHPYRLIRNVDEAARAAAKNRTANAVTVTNLQGTFDLTTAGGWEAASNAAKNAWLGQLTTILDAAMRTATRDLALSFRDTTDYVTDFNDPVDRQMPPPGPNNPNNPNNPNDPNIPNVGGGDGGGGGGGGSDLNLGGGGNDGGTGGGGSDLNLGGGGSGGGTGGGGSDLNLGGGGSGNVEFGQGAAGSGGGGSGLDLGGGGSGGIGGGGTSIGGIGGGGSGLNLGGGGGGGGGTSGGSSGLGGGGSGLGGLGGIGGGTGLGSIGSGSSSSGSGRPGGVTGIGPDDDGKGGGTATSQFPTGVDISGVGGGSSGLGGTGIGSLSGTPAGLAAATGGGASGLAGGDGSGTTGLSGGAGSSGGTGGLTGIGSGAAVGGAGAAGAAGASGGTGYPPPMGGMGGMGGQQNQEKERERKTWLEEDDEVWGTDPDVGPAVIGRVDLPEPETTQPGRPGQSRGPAFPQGPARTRARG
ncbi:hypothetical protein ACIA8K_25770 [Catenuloplanes sp. NPDC051500]|uniref:hypothetical protein n=1 Tax=Catenuloplanes sp. NPDC051500 TaxID=3363959 RepID=UPI0037B4289F